MAPARRATAALLAGAAVCGCTAPDGEDPAEVRRDYLGVETRLMDSDLVNLRVALRGSKDRTDIIAYADCAAAQYALIRGYGFARHVRTNVSEEGGVWRGDAVYTISSALPRGVRTIDAEVVVQNCREQGIPTV